VKSVHRRRKHPAICSKSILRMVPPFVTAHLGIFQKENWGVTAQFSEIIELEFGKKLPYILCILMLF